jgi:hypothetical protein
MSAIIPTVALLNIFLTGDILFSSLLLIYGIVFTTVIYCYGKLNLKKFTI